VGIFERYLTVWVGLGMAAGVGRAAYAAELDAETIKRVRASGISL
jgi:hypothetical protein